MSQGKIPPASGRNGAPPPTPQSHSGTHRNCRVRSLLTLPPGRTSIISDDFARMVTRVAASREGLAADRKRWPLSDQPTPELSPDAVLVRAAQEGDRASFGRLYERYARMVHGVLLAKVPPDDVDDLVQDVFLKALSRLRTLREAASFGAWLAAIARNRGNDYHRRSAPEEPLADDPADNELDLAKTPWPDAPAAAVLQAIQTLPGAYKETLIMRLVEGMTGPEIAARTGLTPGSVRVNLHRGMQHLRAKLCSTPGNRRSAQEPSSS